MALISTQAGQSLIPTYVESLYITELVLTLITHTQENLVEQHVYILLHHP